MLLCCQMTGALSEIGELRPSKPSILPRKCGLSQLFSYFRQKFSLLVISFTHIRVGVVPSSSSSDIFSFLPITRVVLAPKRYGLTSSPVIQWRKGYYYLLSISNHRARKSRSWLEMFDFLILTPKIFNRNEPQVTSRMQVPSVPFRSNQ